MQHDIGSGRGGRATTCTRSGYSANIHHTGLNTQQGFTREGKYPGAPPNQQDTQVQTYRCTTARIVAADQNWYTCTCSFHSYFSIAVYKTDRLTSEPHSQTPLATNKILQRMDYFTCNRKGVEPVHIHNYIHCIHYRK